jgi:MoaA/NifB/PqqE/SkfB family radical SAM enzyme
MIQPIYDFRANFRQRLLACSASDNPHHLEIHLPPVSGQKPCWCSCRYCYGQFHGPVDRSQALRATDLERLIVSTRGLVEKFVFSGIFTDPLYSDLAELTLVTAKELQEQRIGIHTKGIWLSERLKSMLVRRAVPGDYISFSIDTVDQKVFASLHGVTAESRVLERIQDNIETLCERRYAESSPLRVIVTALLLEENATIGQVQDLLGFCQHAGVDVLRFSLPQEPVGAKSPRFTYIQSELSSLIDAIHQLASSSSPCSTPAIVLLQNPDPTPLYVLSRCYAQYFYPTVGWDGYLYPCCQVATGQFPQLRLGDCKQEDFWEIWQSDTVGRLRLFEPASSCGFCCNRRDTEVNLEIEERNGLLEWLSRTTRLQGFAGESNRAPQRDVLGEGHD